jgi:serine/threonine protein kinase
MQIVDGLEALHTNHILHRDLKPNNCLISSNFELKISDFGLSKDLHHDLDISQSRFGEPIGTPAYMSPEALAGLEISYASDIWAFGMIAYEVLSGQLPWGREIKAFALIGNIQHIDIQPKEKLSHLGLSTQILDVIDRCLKRNPKDRYQDAKSLKSDFVPIAKNLRNQIRYLKYQDSWRILIEKDLIKTFFLKRFEQGDFEIKLDDFLNWQEVSHLSLDLDRLNQVWQMISKEFDKLQPLLSQIKINQSNINDLSAQYEIELAKLDILIGEELRAFSTVQMSQKLPEIYEKQKKLKAELDRKFMETKNQEINKSLSANEEVNHKIQIVFDQLKNELEYETKQVQSVSNREKEKDSNINKKENGNYFYLFSCLLCLLIALFFDLNGSFLIVMGIAIYLLYVCTSDSPEEKRRKEEEKRRIEERDHKRLKEICKIAAFISLPVSFIIFLDNSNKKDAIGIAIFSAIGIFIFVVLLISLLYIFYDVLNEKRSEDEDRRKIVERDHKRLKEICKIAAFISLPISFIIFLVNSSRGDAIVTTIFSAIGLFLFVVLLKSLLYILSDIFNAIVKFIINLFSNK